MYEFLVQHLFTDEGIPYTFEALLTEISLFLRADKAECKSLSHQVLLAESIF